MDCIGASGRPLNFTVTPPSGLSDKLDSTVTLDAPTIIFVSAGAAMLLHTVLCGVLRRALIDGEHQALANELFAIPNRWLGTPRANPLIRPNPLLRVRYFFPFHVMPSGVDQLSPSVKATLFAARATGLYFLCAILGFFVAAFIESGM